MNFGRATSSGEKSGSSQITTTESYLMGIDVQPPSVGQAVLKVYDSKNSDTTGKLVLAEIYLDAGLQGLNHVWVLPITANQGIYVAASGTVVNYIVQFMLG